MYVMIFEIYELFYIDNTATKLPMVCYSWKSKEKEEELFAVWNEKYV